MEDDVTRRVRHKNDDGSITEVRIGALAEDVVESEQRMFVTKKEKEVLKELTDVIKVVPTQSGTLTYTGEEQNPEWNNYDPNQLEISGQISGTDAGTYTVTFKPKGNRKWADGTSEPKSISWTIKRATITNFPTQKGALIYTGSIQMPSWNGYDKEKMTIGGTLTGIDAGTYTATFAPTKNYQWQDDSTGQKSVDWIIGRAMVDSVPTQSGTLTYTGAEQMPKWNGYDGGKLKIGGQTAGTHAGDYTATFTPTSNYRWTDGSFTAKNAFWTIKRAVVANVPTQKGTLSYTGNVQAPEWNYYDNNQLEIGGTVNAVEEGTYTATFTPKPDYQWSDGSTSSKTVIWKIGSQVIAKLPTQKGTLTYTGLSQNPVWNDYDSALLIVGGTQTATNAGIYTATFTPQKSSAWWDGTRDAKEVQWEIQKAQGRVTTQTEPLVLHTGNLEKQVSFFHLGDGEISVNSNASDVASVSNVTNDKFLVRGLKTGKAVITISCGEGTNHTAAPPATLNVTVQNGDPILANNTPETIQEIARSGQAANIWSVGDTIGIALNGIVGSCTLNDTYDAFILGFDHNAPLEKDHSIHFSIGKNKEGKDIAFVDSSYNLFPSGPAFKMNADDSNANGWKNSYMRSNICEEFLALMPASWQNVIVACPKYSDNVGGGSNRQENVTMTEDKIWLLAENELFGQIEISNLAEQLYTEQYEYYRNGNAKHRYKHTNELEVTSCQYFLRSVAVNNTIAFGQSIPGASTGKICPVGRSIGFAPCFVVA